MALNDGFTYHLTIGADDTGRWLTDVLASRHAHSSAAAWATRIAGGEIDVDGYLVTADVSVSSGQTIAWRRPPWDEPDVPLVFDVVHEDADVVAVAKPAGLPTMPAGGFLRHTLFALVRARFGEAHPAHRLGRGTSGLVLFARTRLAAAALGSAWRTERVDKEYRALASGTPSWRTCTIATPIGPVPHATLGSVHAASPTGRPARSHVVVREPRGDATLCDVTIDTGRPHQIRIHLAAAGHPLVGDPLYVAGGAPRADAHVLPGEGGYLLHARRLTLPHPRTGDPLSLLAPPPPALRLAAEGAG